MPRASSTSPDSSKSVMAQERATKDPAPSKSLYRALQILELLAEEDGLGLSDVSLRAGLPTSTAHRILTTLQSRGFVAEDEQRHLWFIGVKAFSVGNAFLRNRKLVEIGRRTMRDLMQDTGESVNMAILEGAEVVFISQIESHSTIRAFHRPGSRSALHASATGKALLAAMDDDEVRRLLRQSGMHKFTPTTLTDPKALFAELYEIRERGWAINNEERDPDMRCVAATVFSEFSEPIAALSISGPTSRMSIERLAELGPVVKRAAAQIVASIGGVHPLSGSR